MDPARHAALGFHRLIKKVHMVKRTGVAHQPMGAEPVRETDMNVGSAARSIKGRTLVRSARYSRSRHESYIGESGQRV